MKTYLLIFYLLFCWAPLFAQEEPAAVEEQTEQEADSLAKLLFGDERDEDRAGTYFEHGREDFEAGEAFVKEADSLRAAGVDTALTKPKGVMGMFRQAFGDTALTSREQDIRTRAESSFKAAKKNFERALKTSPEMKDAELWLAATYDRLKEWKNSVDLYREILNERQGDHRLWFNYGYAALQDEQFDKAVTGFDQAMRMFEFGSQNPDSMPNRYRIFAAEAYLRTYQDKLALEMFQQAQAHADSGNADELQKTIDWIQWDNGGIATAEYRDAAYAAEAKEDWQSARLAYLGGISQARTEKARDHLSYRLALIDFNYGSKTEALDRMSQLVESVATPDSQHVESYGKMLYAYATDLEAQGDRRGALKYYLHSTKISWEGQGAGYVAIARIAANNLDQAISNAELALNYPLTDDQRKEAYEVLAQSYRTKGNWEKMRYYQELLETSN